jgi:pimeloyl-ACP methyl ester carboxylesterase
VPFADLAERRIFYDEQGEGVPLLLLGDLAFDHGGWSEQLSAFERHFRVIVLDYPGSGRSQGPGGPYSTELFADVAADVLGGVAEEPAHVLGVSMGGAVAQQLALRHPGLVRSLVLQGTWGRADNHLAAILHSWQTAAQGLPRADLYRQMWPFLFTVWFYNDHADALAALEQRALGFNPQGAEDFCAQAEACITHDALDRLGEIVVPTLIIVGDRDVLTPAHHAYAIKEQLPQARVRVWQKMGHAPHWEAPEEFNAVSLDFFGAH